MQSTKEIIIIIPAYNEEKTIGSVISGAKKYCNVLVVNDSSTDKTEEIAKKNGASIIRNERNMGYDTTLNRGIAEAAKSADVVMIMDADGQHNPDDIPKMLSLIEGNKADFVIGIRPWRIRLSEKIYRRFSKWKIGVIDPLCGFKAFRADVYKKIGYYDSMRSIGTEFMFAVKRNGYRIGQVEISLNPRVDIPRFEGGSSLKAELSIFLAMVKVMVKYSV